MAGHLQLKKHARNSDHSEPSVVDLFRLHGVELLRCHGFRQAAVEHFAWVHAMLARHVPITVAEDDARSERFGDEDGAHGLQTYTHGPTK